MVFNIPEISDLLVDFDNWKPVSGVVYLGVSFAINCIVGWLLACLGIVATLVAIDAFFFSVKGSEYKNCVGSWSDKISEIALDVQLF